MDVKRQVEEALPEWLIDDSEGKRRINELAEQRSRDVLVSPEAKRIRPQIGYKMLKGLGTELDDSEIVQLYTSIEGIHGWSIVLDDVEDDDDMRRGVPSVHAALEKDTGNRELAGFTTINQAVIMNPRSYRPVSELDSVPAETRLEILESLWDSVEELGPGQNLDLGGDYLSQSPRDGVFNQDIAELLSREGEDFDYLEYAEDVDDLKTAALFEVTGDIAGIVEGYEGDELSEYGALAGRAFQIRDNILDFTADEGEIGKDRYSDFREGTMTLPVYFAVRYLESHESEMFTDRAEYILDVLDSENPGEEEMKKAGNLVSYTPAIQAAENVSEVLVEDAISYLDQVDWEKPEYAEDLKNITVYGGLTRSN